jgi:flavin-dependent dehydrogenase
MQRSFCRVHRDWRTKSIVDLPAGEECEFSVKRSLFDDVLLKRAGELGTHIREETTVAVLTNSADWKIDTTGGKFCAHVLVGADGVTRRWRASAICAAAYASAWRCKTHSAASGFLCHIVLSFYPRAISARRPSR